MAVEFWNCFTLLWFLGHIYMYMYIYISNASRVAAQESFHLICHIVTCSTMVVVV